MFEGDYKLVHHLAPPLTAKKNDKGELIKTPFGPWVRSAFGWLAQAEGPARRCARRLRPHRGTQDRARADRRVPRLHRRAAAGAERRQPAAGRRDRAHPRRDPRLRPREGAPPEGRARQVGRPDGAVAQRARSARPPDAVGDWPALRAARAHDVAARAALRRQRRDSGLGGARASARRWAHGRTLLRVGADGVAMHGGAATLQAALDRINPALREQGLILAWRDEVFPLLDPASAAARWRGWSAPRRASGAR